MFESVGRIVGGAHHGDTVAMENLVNRQVSQLLVYLVPNAFGGCLVEQVGDAEIAAQFQVGPVIERVAEGVRHGAGKGEVLVMVARVAGTVFLGNAVGAHRTPLVMITGQPDLVQVVEGLVGSDLRRRQVGVVIEDRFVAGDVVVQGPRHIVAQQEIFTKKFSRHDFKPDSNRRGTQRHADSKRSRKQTRATAGQAASGAERSAQVIRAGLRGDDFFLEGRAGDEIRQTALVGRAVQRQLDRLVLQ